MCCKYDENRNARRKICMVEEILVRPEDQVGGTESFADLMANGQ